MKSLRDAADRETVIARIGRLTSSSPAKWGRLRAPEMLAHLAQSMEMATGALPVRARRTVLRLPIVKHLAIYLLPFPKGLPTAPELLARTPMEWAGEVAHLTRAIGALAARDDTAAWPEHPVFGRLGARDWGVLQYRHADHHLRQFGA